MRTIGNVVIGIACWFVGAQFPFPTMLITIPLLMAVFLSLYNLTFKLEGD